MPRPFGNRTAYTFGYYPQHGRAPGALTVAHQTYPGRRAAADAAARAAGDLGCEVTGPLRVIIEIPKGVKR